MKIEATHIRSGTGHSIEVKITREGAETIAEVEATLDGFLLARDPLNPPQVHYERFFNKVGTGGPGDHHTLAVSGTDQHNGLHGGTFKWTDSL